MTRVYRMTASDFWWDDPREPDAELGYVKLTCATPTADAWEVKFPRYRVEYGGVCASRSMRLGVDDIAERSIAEQIRARILASPAKQRAFRDLWAEVHDMGRAPHEAFDTGAGFWAVGGSASGRKGSIVIRNRYSAAVQWDGEPFTGGTTYPLDLMVTAPPVERRISYSMGWLKGR